MVGPESAKRFWDSGATRSPARYSSSGSSLIDEAFFVSGDRDVRFLLNEFGIRLSVDSTVLELGSGAGRMTRALADMAGRVIAADISPAMLELGRRNDRSGRLEVLELAGDGLIDLPDRSVDLVISLATLTHISDRRVLERYLQESIRVIKPWGKIVVQVRRRSMRGDAIELAAGLRNLARGIRSWAPYWRGAGVSPESLVSLHTQVGLLSLLSVEPRFMWVVIDMYGSQS